MSSLREETYYLFNCNYFDDSFDPEDNEIHLLKSQELQKQFSWNDIILEWHNYLYNNCHTPAEVINFANLFFYYGGTDNYNPNPYKFLGYLYARVDVDIYWEQAGDLFDSIAIDILQHQLLANLNEDPYYSPLKDEKILNEITIWKKSFI